MIITDLVMTLRAEPLLTQKPGVQFAKTAITLHSYNLAALRCNAELEAQPCKTSVILQRQYWRAVIKSRTPKHLDNFWSAALTQIASFWSGFPGIPIKSDRYLQMRKEILAK